MTPLDTMLVSAYTGGIQVATEFQAQNHYVARAYQDASGNINIEYVPASTAYAADSAVAAALAPLLRGIGLTVDSANKLRPRDRLRKVRVRDPFISGPNAAAAVVGTLGALGWTLSGAGTPTFTRQNRGLITSLGSFLNSSTSTNDRSSLTLGAAESSNGVIQAAELNLLQCIQATTVLTNRRVFFGLSSDFSQNPLTTSGDALGFAYDSAVSPNWQLVCRASGTGAPQVTSTAVGTAMLMPTILQASTGVYQFYIGGTLLGSASTNVPTTACNVGWRVETLTNAAAGVRVADFLLESVDLGGAWDDDAFLEV